MPAEGLRAAPNENSMQTLRHRFYSAVIIAPHPQMKTSMAGRENNEVVKKKNKKKRKTKNGRVMLRDRPPSPPSSCNPIGWMGWGEWEAQVQLQGGPAQARRFQRAKAAAKVPAAPSLQGATRLARHPGTSVSACDVIMFPLAFAFPIMHAGYRAKLTL